MTMPAIRVERLSKVYAVGAQHSAYRTLGESISHWAAARRRRSKGSDETLAPPNRIWALRDVSFEVESGDVVGVIGRNGAGKSTLLKILSRITEPSSGRVEVQGRIASMLEVGTGFHPELTGRENIYLSGAILGMMRQEIKARFDEIVAFAEIERFIDTPVKRYSSGMYLRLAFAVAAHLEPEILLIDEILAVGDQEFQSRCIGRMRDVSRSGRTVLFVSHNLAAVSSLCTRGLLIDGGRLVRSGGVSEVIAEYHGSVRSQIGDKQNLADLPRRGTGAARISGFRTIDRHGSPVQHLSLGERAQFEITFECRERVRAPAFAIAFDTLDGRRVLRLESCEMVGSLPPCERGGKVVCSVDELLITPGPYLITLAIGSSGKDAIDYLSHCIQVEVLPADVHGTGKLPTQASSAYVARGSWTWGYQ